MKTDTDTDTIRRSVVKSYCRIILLYREEEGIRLCRPQVLIRAGRRILFRDHRKSSEVSTYFLLSIL